MEYPVRFMTIFSLVDVWVVFAFFTNRKNQPNIQTKRSTMTNHVGMF